jgi:hypothetical protein
LNFALSMVDFRRDFTNRNLLLAGTVLLTGTLPMVILLTVAEPPVLLFSGAQAEIKAATTYGLG